MENKILYTLNVPWSWIEQRPHILANKLATNFDVTCVSPRSMYKSVIKAEKNYSCFNGASRSYYYLPKKIDWGVVHAINSSVNKHRCYRDIGCFGCAWLSHPCQIDCVPSTYSGVIVYDCMDDYAAMVRNSARAALMRQEKTLIDRADIIFVSSRYLQEAVGDDRAVLVRNGYKHGNLHSICEPELQNTYTIAYFGTISEWFDFDAIDAVVQKLDNISFRVIGPTEVRRDIERVEYKDPIKHQQLFDSISDCSCLIMPFKVNDIIKAVDPVKLYEYIAFGKCVISVRYPEVERFGDYVYFYESAEELVELVNDLAGRGFPPKYTDKSREAFLHDNTWESRIETIMAALAKCGIVPR